MDLGTTRASATLLLGAPLLLLAGLSCDSPSSLCSSVNGDVILLARVDDTETNTRIELAFTDADGSGISRSFCANDTVTVNGEVATKVRRPSGNTVFALNLAAPAATYAIVVTHDDVQTELLAAPEMQSLSLSKPAAGSELSRKDPFTVAWEPALGEAAEVTVIAGDRVGASACLAELFTRDIADTGTFDVPAGSLAVGSGLPDSITCEAFVEIIRLDEVSFELRSGTAFHPDSRMIAASERSIEFQSVPVLPQG